MGDENASFEPRSRNPTIRKKAHNLHLKQIVKSMLCFDIGFFLSSTTKKLSLSHFFMLCLPKTLFLFAPSLGKLDSLSVKWLGG